MMDGASYVYGSMSEIASDVRLATERETSRTKIQRAPFQVLVFLVRVVDGQRQYLLLKRSDLKVWQGVAGGGEGKETPLEAALREIQEETGIAINALHKLDAIAQLPVECVTGDFIWGKDVTEIPEYAFMSFVDDDVSPVLSVEHTEYRWCNFKEACGLLEWESNRAALREAEGWKI